MRTKKGRFSCCIPQVSRVPLRQSHLLLTSRNDEFRDTSVQVLTCGMWIERKQTSTTGVHQKRSGRSVLVRPVQMFPPDKKFLQRFRRIIRGIPSPSQKWSSVRTTGPLGDRGEAECLRCSVYYSTAYCSLGTRGLLRRVTRVSVTEQATKLLCSAFKDLPGLQCRQQLLYCRRKANGSSG